MLVLAGVCLLAVMRCSVQKCVLLLEEVCVFGLGVMLECVNMGRSV